MIAQSIFILKSMCYANTMITDISALAEIYSVSQLNREIRHTLEGSYPSLWIEGEISNLKRPSSGHYYLSLKDEYAQVRAAFFRIQQKSLKFTPQDGMRVLVLARVSLYEERGEFQLIIEQMQQMGDGILQKAFEALKKRLQEEGLFATEHKKSLPLLPQKIGVITSATGAAIRDILIVLKRRFPSIPIIIYPTMVQGDEAAKQIVSALQKANERQECDVLILARGGGSLEDLWPFNEEIVARAIFASKIPIISGIGHEVDTTIADFVADHRAATPSAAAEQVTPHRQDYLFRVNELYSRLTHLIKINLRHLTIVFEGLAKRVQHPGQYLMHYTQRLDNLERQLLQAQFNNLRGKQQHLALLIRALDAVSPLNTLQRGYAIAMKDKKIIYAANQVKSGDAIHVQLAKGSLDCTVNSSC
jgi:exodeoxyribonuclease VII large subunit